MIKVQIDNEILNILINIEKNKEILNTVEIPLSLSNKFRKNTKKRSAYSSNKIEGNPLTFAQASKIIEEDNRHFLKPEKEVRNYYLALNTLEKKLENNVHYSTKLLLEIQKIVCEGEPKNKIGLRGQMPPGVLFAVWDQKTGRPDYIPPEYSDIPVLLQELEEYVNNSDDHPIIKAAIVHYQLVTIHPFEDGNGRTARIMSNYILSYYGYSFKNIGSLEEYFSYDIDEYYSSIQMGLPVLYYEGRDNPPKPYIWIKYFLKIFNLYASKVIQIAYDEFDTNEKIRLNNLSSKGRAFLEYLRKNKIINFTPIDISRQLKVTNRTIINWCNELMNNGFIKPVIENKRIRRYEVQ